MKTRMKLVLLLIPIVLIAIVYLRVTNSESAADPRRQSATLVKVEPPKREKVDESIQLTGDVLPIQQAQVFSRVSGNLESVLVNMGDYVHANQMLAHIDTTVLAQQYNQALATYENDSLLFERSKSLLDENLAAREDYDNAQTALKVAASNYQTARTQLGYAAITAPFSGFITRRYLDPGALVNSTSSTLFTLMDLDMIKIIVNVLEKDVPRISEGTKAVVVVDAYPGKEFVGKIARLSQSLDLSTRTMPVEVDVPNADHILKPGMFASASLIVGENANALTIPTQALLKDVKGDFVYVATGGVAKRTGVSTGAEHQSRTEILSGLSDQDSVITTGQQYAKDGGPLKVLQ
jgi:RND family efflux transporter MFP subunit